MSRRILVNATGTFLLLAVFVTAVLAFPGAVLADMPSTIRIGLTRDLANRDSIHISNTHISAGYDSGGSFAVVTSLQAAGGFTARVAGGVVVLYSGGQQVFTFDDASRGAQVACATGGTVRLGDYSYRGVIELRPSGGRLTAINVLCPEEYLYGVLPVEMTHTFHINALKAQAIASRTFMAYRMNDGGHRHQGFDLCDTTHCQSYRGAGREQESTSLAVELTRGQMMFYNNTVILAVYFASCGGATDYAENVWGQPRPYLRAVRSVGEHNPSEWTRTFTMAQLTTAVNSAGGNIGTATGMSVSRVSPLGRVQEITVYGTSGQWRASGEATRTLFAPVGGSLMSRNFYIAGAGGGPAVVSVTDGRGVVSGGLTGFNLRGGVLPQTAYVFDGTALRRLDAAPAQVVTGSSVTINGRGWGHGVGMSQRGAIGMALLGYSYREILLHYYTGVEIR